MSNLFALVMCALAGFAAGLGVAAVLLDTPPKSEQP